MQKNSFTVLIEKDEDGIYVASVPALPGCHTQASNLDDLEARIEEVIKLCMADKNADDIRTETFGYGVNSPTSTKISIKPP